MTMPYIPKTGLETEKASEANHVETNDVGYIGFEKT
jgi:hypothetical protein